LWPLFLELLLYIVEVAGKVFIFHDPSRAFGVAVMGSFENYTLSIIAARTSRQPQPYLCPSQTFGQSFPISPRTVST